jgi:arylsulfatase A-like enzyme
MTNQLNRREFIKLAGLASLGAGIPQFFSKPAQLQDGAGKPNILMIVFDAWSAEDVSLYGFPRNTTPNIDRLAERAVVFHKHQAGGKFTTPATASLLTGTQPWTHRAYRFFDTVRADRTDHNIFQHLSGYHRMAYSHNPLANALLRQFINDLDSFTNWDDLYLTNEKILDALFEEDFDIGSVAWTRALKNDEETRASYSLFFSEFYQQSRQLGIDEISQFFPLGLPDYNDDNYFLLEDGIDFALAQTAEAPGPYLGYFHYYPPHGPYHTRDIYYRAFAGDGFMPPEKPYHPIGKGFPLWKLTEKRNDYDEFILYVDAEFNRLYETLSARGDLDNTWIILTADHGEMFERGIKGHITPSLHQPIAHIPLLIFPPGQQERVDIFEPTSALDILPTLSKIAGLETPAWAEGNVLPPFAESGQQKQDIHIIDIQAEAENGDILTGTASIVRGNHQLIYWFGYNELESDIIEIYDLENDPEGLQDLSLTDKPLTDELMAALMDKIQEANEAYQPNSAG